MQPHEVLDAQSLCHNMVDEAAKARDPPIAPPGLQAAVQAAVQAAIGPAVQAALAPLAAQMQAAIGPVTAQLTSLSAQVHNMQARMFNKRQSDARAGPGPLHGIVKEAHGVGPGLPGLAAPANGPALAMGAVHPLFPASREALGRLTRANLHQMAVDYNHDFGVVQNDNVAVARLKFEQWICGDLQ